MSLALVQHAQNKANSNTVTVTLASTGAGNTLIVCYWGGLSGTDTDLTGVTLGGSGTGFSSQASLVSSAVNGGIVSVWANYSIAGGQTSLVATAASGNDPISIDAYEVSGGLKGLDKSASNYVNGTAAAWTSGATGTTGFPAEFWVGIMGGYNNAGPSPTLSGPGGSWTSETAQFPATGQFGFSGYQVTTTPAAATWSGSSNMTGTNNNYLALVATFYQAGNPARSRVYSQAVNRASTY